MDTQIYKITNITKDNIIKVWESCNTILDTTFTKEYEKVQNGNSITIQVHQEVNDEAKFVIEITAEDFIKKFHTTPTRVKLKLHKVPKEILEDYKFLQHPDLVLSTQPKLVTVHNDVLQMIIHDYSKEYVITIPGDAYIVVPEEEFQKLQKTILYDLNSYNTIICKFSLNWLFTDYIMDSMRMESPLRLRYNENLRVSSDGAYWRPLGTQTKFFKTHYMREQIRTRYGFFERPISGLSNVVMDSFFPRLLHMYKCDRQRLLRDETFPSTAVAISPLVAEYLNIKQVPLEQLCRVLGYTTKDITKLLKAVKAKQKKVIFVGAGGTGINTAYWLSSLTEMVNIPNLFDKVGVFENDTIEFSNMLRFPLSLSYYAHSGTANKLQLIEPLLEKLSKRNINVNTQYLTSSTYCYSTEHLLNYNHYRHDNEPVYTTAENTVLYGAPEIAYREDLAKIGPLICATHADTTCSIWLNPKQNDEIQVETYGLIQLGSFFMNQLKMAISFLELLASNQDLTAVDHHVMDFEFDGTIQLRTERQYHWQIDKDLLVMTAEQADRT